MEGDPLNLLLNCLMIVCSWNIRGLNDPNKTTTLSKFLSRNKVDVMAVLETRVKHKNTTRI